MSFNNPVGSFGKCSQYCQTPFMFVQCWGKNPDGSKCGRGVHHECSAGVGLAGEGDGWDGMEMHCRDECMVSRRGFSPNTRENTANAGGAAADLPEQPQELIDRANRHYAEERAKADAATTTSRSPSPAEETRDEDMNLQERRKRFGPQGATHFQRGVNRRHDEGHLGGSHGRQAGMAHYDEILPQEGEEHDSRAGGLKCAECGKDYPRKVNMCPGCRWSMHATCGTLGLLNARCRHCGGCLAQVSKEDAAKLARRDAATKKRLIEAGALTKPITRKRKGGGSSGNRSSSGNKRRRDGAGGSSGGGGNNNNNNNNNNDDSTGGTNDSNNNDTTATTATAAADDADATTDNAGRRILANPVSTAQMREGVVDDT